MDKDNYKESYDFWKLKNPLLAEYEELEFWLSLLDNPEDDEPDAVERYKEIDMILKLREDVSK